MGDVSIALDILSLAITALIMGCYYADKPSDKSGKWFVLLPKVNVIALLADIATWIFEGNPDYTVALYISNMFVFILGDLMVALCSVYVFIYIQEHNKKFRYSVAAIFITFAIAVVPIVLSLFNNIYFYIEDGFYRRGTYYIFSQIFPYACVIADSVIIIVNAKKLNKTALSLLSYGVIPSIMLIIQTFNYGLSLQFTSSTVAFLIIYLTVLVRNSHLLKQKEIELNEAKVSIMLSQIQPHFLYNVLTSISVLCDRDPKQAKEAVIFFSKYLRGNLESINSKAPVAFETELNHVKNYLTLEKMRYGDDLKINYDIMTESFLIPSLALQPLAENAVKHGVGQKENGGTITISTREDDKGYYVSVSDDGVGFDVNAKMNDGKVHIGIDNVRKRMLSMCGGTLNYISEKGVGTSATLFIPKGENK